MNGGNAVTHLEAADPDVNLFLNETSCNYCTIADYIVDFPVSPQFSLLNQNVQSFQSKKPQLEALIGATNHSFHALILTETWNTADNKVLCNMDGFTAVHSYRNTPAPSRGGIGGGVSIFANCNLYKLKKIDHLSYCNETIEVCTTQIIPRNSDDKSDHFIVGTYRPHTDTIENFVLALQQLFSDDIFATSQPAQSVSAIQDPNQTLPALPYPVPEVAALRGGRGQGRGGRGRGGRGM